MVSRYVPRDPEDALRRALEGPGMVAEEIAELWRAMNALAAQTGARRTRKTGAQPSIQSLLEQAVIAGELGTVLAALRKEKWLSQDGLANLSKVSSKTIANLEGGHTRPRANTLRKLARALEEAS